MTPTENNMLDLLKKGRDRYGVVAVKAEFEAEGTRPDEFLRLLELARRADLKVALKIGGCEAISDLQSSKLYGVDYIIAPMVETKYALSKFIESKQKIYGKKENSAQFLFNLETETTLGNLKEMLPLAIEGVHGVVFGRVDFTLSRGLSRSSVNERQVTESVLLVAKACAEADLELVVGGSVSAEAVEALREVRRVRLDRFETRKVVFDGAIIDSSLATLAIANAVEFELAWLKYKRDYYAEIASEDNGRISMIEARIGPLDERQRLSA
jgi:hypothetical protein